MFRFIKTKLFGSKLFQRTASANINSKFKVQDQQKRPLSIDSKQKIESKKNQLEHECPQVIQIDQHMPNVYQYPINHCGNEDIGCLMVSQAGSFENNNVYLTLSQQPNLLQGLSQSYEQVGQIEPVINPKRKQLIPNYINEGIVYQTLTRNGKILVKRSPQKKIIKKIQEKCSICKKVLNYSDSIQLACTHRCHKSCSVKMQWRMKYTCDLCQSRNEKKHLVK